MKMAEESELRIGIFTCECGGHVSDVIDVDAVCNRVENWKGVHVTKRDTYLCSNPAQEMILNEIKRNNLNRVIVAACTPRMHLATFQNVVERAGLNPYLLTFTNIREQCSWVHGSQKSIESTEKAISLIRGGYERSFELEPLEAIREKCSTETLVVGGGIAGITTSLELANLRHKVHLVERYPSIGGNMAKLTKVFPTLDCAQCILTPKMAEVGMTKNVELYTNTDIIDIRGRPGNYEVEIFRKPRGVDVEKCTGCDDCTKICPVTCPDEFNEYKSTRKAAYIPFQQAVPYAYAIDFSTCTKCGKCVEVCPTNAIDLEDEGNTISLTVGGIIVATGYESFDANRIREYGYGSYPDVITMIDLERMTSLFGPTEGKIIRFSNNEDVKRLAIILCAGSRDEKYIPYCSRICCMYSIKQATLLREQLDIDVWIYFMDIRATGKGYEELYWRAQNSGVVFVRGNIAEVGMKPNGMLSVLAEDMLLCSVIEQEFDLVALAVPLIPSSGLDELARKLRLPLGSEGFVQEKHPKLEPLNSLLTGVFAAGCSLGPKDVRDTVSDALGAAAKISSFLGEGYIVGSPEKAFVIPELCNNCGLCLEICPLNAITLIDEKAEVTTLLCNGCGACIPECPEEAIDLKNSTKKQLYSSMKGLLADKKPDEVRIIAFVEKTIAYTGTDFLGLDRMHYPQSVRILAIPSTAIISSRHIFAAFVMGADGVILIEGQPEVDSKFTRKKMEDTKSAIEELGIESERIYYSLVELPAYKKIGNLFSSHAEMIREIGPLPAQSIDAIKTKVKVN